MAKIRPGPLHPDAFPHHRGVLYTRDTRHGAVVQAWPTRRKKANDRQSVWWREVFKIAAEMAANPHPLDYGTAVEMVKGTEYVPRDWLMKCIYGNAYEVVLPDGTTMEVSDKGPPEDFMPSPQPPPTEPEGPEMAWQWSMTDTGWTASLDNAQFSFKGCVFVPKIAAICKGVRIIAAPVANEPHRLLLAKMQPGAKLGEILVSHDVTPTAFGRHLLDKPADFTLDPDTEYCVLFGRTSGTPQNVLQIPQPPQGYFLWPCTLKSRARIASLNPQAGDTIDISGGAAVPFGLLLDV